MVYCIALYSMLSETGKQILSASHIQLYIELGAQ